jgi:hypothetical protein
MRSEHVGGAVTSGHGQSLATRLSEAFKKETVKGLEPVLTADDLDKNDKIPARVLKNNGIPEQAAERFYAQIQIVEDGTLSLYELPFGKNNHFWVVSAQGGDGTLENDYYSKHGVHSAHEELSTP